MAKLIERVGNNYQINIFMLDDISKVIFDNIRNVGLSILVGGSGILYAASHATTLGWTIGTFLFLLSYALVAFNFMHAMFRIIYIAKHKYLSGFFVILFYICLFSLLAALQSSALTDIEKKIAPSPAMQPPARPAGS